MIHRLQPSPNTRKNHPGQARRILVCEATVDLRVLEVLVQGDSIKILRAKRARKGFELRKIPKEKSAKSVTFPPRRKKRNGKSGKGRERGQERRKNETGKRGAMTPNARWRKAFASQSEKKRKEKKPKSPRRARPIR
jgi:hypothetical protein